MGFFQALDAEHVAGLSGVFCPPARPSFMFNQGLHPCDPAERSRLGRSHALRGPRAALCLLSAAMVVLSAAACAGSSGGSPAPQQPPSPTARTSDQLGSNLARVQFRSPSGAQAELRVRVEGTEPDRERGLMNITALPEDEGDLFLWQDVAPNADVLAPFWMKDTKIPLSIAFVGGDGRILEEQDMEAESETLHVPRLPYRFAIEANQGWYARHGMPPGAVATLPGVISPLLLPPATAPR